MHEDLALDPADLPAGRHASSHFLANNFGACLCILNCAQVASRYLQDWVNGVSQLDPDILKEAASQGASPVGGETSPGLHGSPGERAFSGRCV